MLHIFTERLLWNHQLDRKHIKMVTTGTITTAIFILLHLVTLCYGQRLEEDRISEVSWRLREITKTTALLKEIAILLLPCDELLVNGHLLEFLTKLLKHADVEYESTRVSLW